MTSIPNDPSARLTTLWTCSFWSMSRVSASIEIGPRGLSLKVQPRRTAIALSPSILPSSSRITVAIAAIPSQPWTPMKSGVVSAP